MNADRIYADPSTITGSIGIFGLIPTIPRTLEKIGVHTDGVGTTRFAGAFDITRPLDPDVGRIVQSVIDKGYRDFTGRVAKARGRSVEEIDAIARGRVWSGAEAKQRGLVDTFGGLEDAIADAAARAKLGKSNAWQVRYIEKAATPFERFFTRFAQNRVAAAWLQDSSLGQAMLAHALPQTRTDLHFIDAALKSGRGAPAKAMAYCFCGL
jgi:protease-4